MKKYIYSPHHQGLVLAPLMTEPNKDKFRGIDPGFFEFDHIGYNKEMKAYNTWLSSPPIAKVPDEHKEWFSVERDESEFEVRHQIFSREGKWLDCPKEVYERHSGLLQRETRLVAIPKEESKLTNLDHWFVATLKSLIGAEEYMVKRGIKKEIDRNILSAWVKRHSSNINEEQEDSPIEAKQSKMGLRSGDWYLNERGNRITVLYVVDGWCMVREGDKKPFVVPEELVLGTFNS
jgi:hypothetical protein